MKFVYSNVVTLSTLLTVLNQRIYLNFLMCK